MTKYRIRQVTFIGGESRFFPESSWTNKDGVDVWSELFGCDLDGYNTLEKAKDEIEFSIKTSGSAQEAIKRFQERYLGAITTYIDYTN